MIEAKDVELFQFADSPAEALALLQRGLVTEMVHATPSLARSVTPDLAP